MVCMNCEYELNEEELRKVILDGCPKCGCLHMKSDLGVNIKWIMKQELH